METQESKTVLQILEDERTTLMLQIEHNQFKNQELKKAIDLMPNVYGEDFDVRFHMVTGQNYDDGSKWNDPSVFGYMSIIETQQSQLMTLALKIKEEQKRSRRAELDKIRHDKAKEEKQKFIESETEEQRIIRLEALIQKKKKDNKKRYEAKKAINEPVGKTVNETLKDNEEKHKKEKQKLRRKQLDKERKAKKRLEEKETK
tara:strand:+ start:111 stop:716 length:606 start_codon:yes stop_codon:yes gene_type:complete